MELNNLYALKENYNREGILICFAGPFSHSIIEELGNAVKRYLEVEQTTRAAMMDVFSIFIEQTQNVRNYGRQKAGEGNRDHDFTSGIVVIARNGESHEVSSGNIVETDDIRDTMAWLDTLRGLNKAELKAAYKEQMRKEPVAGKGAGLGLIDMSRKSAKPLQYTVTPIDDRYGFFSLKATI
jgi:hypothetical protein